MSTSSSRPLDAAAMAIVVIMCMTWGFNQVAVKLALPDVPPLIQATIRSAGAALIALAWTRSRKIPLLVRDGALWAGLAAGVLFSIEFILIYRGLLLTTATRAVLFIYMAPFFVTLGAWWLLPAERIGGLQWFGLVLSFAGVALALGIPSGAADPQAFIGDIMMIFAAAAWASVTLIIKASKLSQVAPEKTLLYQVVVSAPLLGLAAWMFGETISIMPSRVALASLAFQTIWVVGITFLVWFFLIVRYSASRLSAFTFLTPLFGVAAGHLILNEPLNAAFAASAGLVAAGLILVNRPR